MSSNKGRTSKRTRAVRQAENILRKYEQQPKRQRKTRRKRRNVKPAQKSKSSQRRAYQTYHGQSSNQGTLDVKTPIGRALEAATHPFGADALGALALDCRDSICIPGTDITEFPIEPISTATGVWMTWLPRCAASGLLSGTTTQATGAVKANNGLRFEDQDGIQREFETIITDPMEMNELFGWGLVYGFINTEGYSMVTNTNAGALHRLTKRANKFVSDLESFRVVGAGLKVRATKPPLTAGGRLSAGSIRLDKLVALLKQNYTDATNSEPGGPFQNFADNWSGMRTMYDARQGCTVRFEPYQAGVMKKKKVLPDFINQRSTHAGTITQIEKKYDVIETDEIRVQTPPAQVYYSNLVFEGGTDPSTYDLVTPQVQIPVWYWMYESASENYTLSIQSIVHIHGTPKGDFPYKTSSCYIHPGFEVIMNLTNDHDIFPVYSKSNSFKSIIRKIPQIIRLIRKYAGIANKGLDVINTGAEFIGGLTL